MSWVRIDDQFPDHPKIVRAGPAAAWLYVCGLCYCARYLTDGIVPRGQVRRLADIDDPAAAAAALVGAGLWEETEAGYAVHDYLAYNPDRARVEAIRTARAEAGAKGGKQKAANAHAAPEPNTQHIPSIESSKLLAVGYDAATDNALAKSCPVPLPVPVLENVNTQGENAREKSSADGPPPVEAAPDDAPPGSAPSPPKAKAEPGGPLPADWRPDAGLLAWAEGKGWPRGWIDDQTELFLGYWREERPTERKRAWGQAWQRWLNAEAAKRRPASNGHAPHRPAGPPVAAGPGYAVLPAGKPLPEGWTPGRDLLSWAAREGWEPEAVEAVTAEFADRARGTGRLNADWGAAWKTFLRGYRRPAAPAKGAA